MYYLEVFNSNSKELEFSSMRELEAFLEEHPETERGQIYDDNGIVDEHKRLLDEMTTKEKTSVIDWFLNQCVELGSWLDLSRTYIEDISQGRERNIYLRYITYVSRRGYYDALDSKEYVIPLSAFLSETNIDR